LCFLSFLAMLLFWENSKWSFFSCMQQKHLLWYVIPTRCTSHKSFLFNLVTAVHVSGVTTTHPQEHKATASRASGNHYTVLLSAAIVEKFQLFHDSSR
jgi:hypothetical protein